MKLWRVEWWGKACAAFVDPGWQAHFDGRWQPPPLGPRPVDALLEEHRRLGVDPDEWLAAAAPAAARAGQPGLPAPRQRLPGQRPFEPGAPGAPVALDNGVLLRHFVSIPSPYENPAAGHARSRRI